MSLAALFDSQYLKPRKGLGMKLLLLILAYRSHQSEVRKSFLTLILQNIDLE